MRPNTNAGKNSHCITGEILKNQGHLPNAKGTSVPKSLLTALGVGFIGDWLVIRLHGTIINKQLFITYKETS